MTFREATRKDFHVLTKILNAEEIPRMYMHHEKVVVRNTVMLDKNRIVGFYTWNQQYGKAALIHFCIEKAKRTNHVVRLLIRHFVATIKKQGLKGIIVCIPANHKELTQFINYYFKNVEPYALASHGLYLKAEVN